MTDQRVAAPMPAEEAIVPDDLADVALAASGDGYALERFYRQHAARLHTLARPMTGPEHADDLTQDVFVRAWEKLASFRGEAAFGTWLHRLAINVILSARSRIGRDRNRYLADEGAVAASATRTPRPGLAMDLEAAIDGLPDGARRVFVLHDVEGYKHEEIGGLLGIATGTSKAQLHRARMLLREQLSGTKERA